MVLVETLRFVLVALYIFLLSYDLLKCSIPLVLQLSTQKSTYVPRMDLFTCLMIRSYEVRQKISPDLGKWHGLNHSKWLRFGFEVSLFERFLLHLARGCSCKFYSSKHSRRWNACSSVFEKLMYRRLCPILTSSSNAELRAISINASKSNNSLPWDWWV